MRPLLPASLYLLCYFSFISSCTSVWKQKTMLSKSTETDWGKRNFAIKLYDESYSLNTFVSKFIPVVNYDLSYIDSNNFRAFYSDSLNNLPIVWRFGVENNSLTYYGFRFEECNLNENGFDKFFRISDSLISAFTDHYGLPGKKTINKNNFYSHNRSPKYPGVIVGGIWFVDGQQIEVSFKASREHNIYSYSLDVSRYKPSKTGTK